jgi:putative DNA methylase
MPKKLIEVALPLEEINKASAREKSIRHGHPSTLHLWWARRPLAAARAVIFSSLITDPGDPDYPWQDGQERDVEKERGRLHQLIVDLVQWENSTNERILQQARNEIMRHTNGNPPPLLDPFAGGGAIPFEAQRLGLEAHASDLNPVAVLINKAMIEIPPKFAGQSPVNPDHRHQMKVQWKGAAGLAEDVRYYGKWMRDEAERRIGHLYPKVSLPQEQGGGEATVIAWLWARTVTCPNPACGAEMPLLSSFALSKKKGKEWYIRPKVSGKHIRFQVGRKSDLAVDDPNKGYKRGTSGIFECAFCGEITTRDYVAGQGAHGGLGAMPTAIVAEGRRGRAYISASDVDLSYLDALPAIDIAGLDMPLSSNPRDLWCRNFGLNTIADLFTERQLVTHTVFSDLVREVRERVAVDAAEFSFVSDHSTGGDCASEYADAIATYLAIAADRGVDRNSTICTWDSSPKMEALRNTFARQAIPMTWDFAEGNPFSGSSGNWDNNIDWVTKVLSFMRPTAKGKASQADATTLQPDSGIVSTDPPYYDNISYADLSDFFYVWLRRSLSDIYPDLFVTMLVPKIEELVATSYRFEGGKAEAESFFEGGLRQAFSRLSKGQAAEFPATVYYAFKQAETETRGGDGSQTASTGWETMLEGLISSGFQITGTWPMRTELANRMVGRDTNVLASSIVLACRVRPATAAEVTRQQFLREMRQKLAEDLRPLQHSNIAPVDLAQAAIGPGMAIYSKYSRVREASGDSLRVREALALINQVLDEVLAEQDEEYDPETRWAITWYETHGMNDGPYGDAEGLSKARNVAVDDLAHDGMVRSGRGKVRFVWREEYPALPPTWHPRSRDVSDWVIMQRLAQAVQAGQEPAAAIKARMDATLPGRTDLARDLAYRAYNIAERKGWAREALVYNTLVQNWADIEKIAGDMAPSDVEYQLALDL